MINSFLSFTFYNKESGTAARGGSSDQNDRSRSSSARICITYWGVLCDSFPVGAFGSITFRRTIWLWQLFLLRNTIALRRIQLFSASFILSIFLRGVCSNSPTLLIIKQKTILKVSPYLQWEWIGFLFHCVVVPSFWWLQRVLLWNWGLGTSISNIVCPTRGARLFF